MQRYNFFRLFAFFRCKNCSFSKNNIYLYIKSKSDLFDRVQLITMIKEHLQQNIIFFEYKTNGCYFIKDQ